MASSELESQFASPEKESSDKLKVQINKFSKKDLYALLLDSTPNYLLVLNDKRQIVFANKSMRELVQGNFSNSLYGARLGEILECEHAFENKAGCGTSEFCKTCGAIHAILSSLKGEEEVQECRITRQNSKESLDLRVWTKPLILDGEKFSVFTFIDISHEKRRMALERVFFHDVLNTAGGIKSFLNVLQDSPIEDLNQYIDFGTQLANKLVEEIKSQRDLTLAEQNELLLDFQVCNPAQIVNDTVNFYKSTLITKGKTIDVKISEKKVNFITDGILISRILGNMLKNALEASSAGDKVTIGYTLSNDSICFYVHNNYYIPQETQLQIFNRSFSTKGNDRGLGTYSMRLLSKNFLNGKVYFNSDKEKGTTFYAEYPLIPK